ncbi:MAG: hypothetical protein IKC52_06750 [Clostridia bacterium]|nr:hypothetical protein [Clostridia bacterium]
MKHTQIFLASSIVEFEDEREAIGACLYKSLPGVRIVDCTYTDSSISTEGSQSVLNKMLQQSDCAVFLFGKKLGYYTQMEFEIAQKQFAETGKPKIFVFCQHYDGEISPHVLQLLTLHKQPHFAFGNFDEVLAYIKTNTALFC